MFRPRIIPVLLLKNNGLVKSVKFKNYQYIGDPINAVKLFNDFKADEIIFLDIQAGKEKRLISLDFVKNVGEEANMSFAVGGGIRKIDDIKKIINAGAEKIVLSTIAIENPEFVRLASKEFGSSTIAVCIDVKKNIFGKEYLWTYSGKISHNTKPEDFSKIMEEMGAGELIIQSIDKDGTMSGYDMELLKKITKSVTIPVVALGGAGNLDHMKEAFYNGYANGMAAGSMFVYNGANRGVLINYPERIDIDTNFRD